MQEKRLAAMKARFLAEKMHQAQGHGDYREIVEDEFLKEVCGSLNVVVHFSVTISPIQPHHPTCPPACVCYLPERPSI